MYTLPSRAELMKMPIPFLRNIRIENGEQESEIQAVLNLRVHHMPVATKVYRGDVPVKIMNGDEEKKWQDIIDQRTKELADAQLKGGDAVLSEAEVEKEIAQLEKEQEEVEEELQEFKPVKDAFCQFCDAVGPISHKKVCNRTK